MNQRNFLFFLFDFFWGEGGRILVDFFLDSMDFFQTDKQTDKRKKE